MNEEKCICEYAGLDIGVTLCAEDSGNGGIEHIRNKYCPICGKKLPIREWKDSHDLPSVE